MILLYLFVIEEFLFTRNNFMLCNASQDNILYKRMVKCMVLYKKNFIHDCISKSGNISWVKTSDSYYILERIIALWVCKIFGVNER